MKNTFVIYTDATCDMPAQFYEKDLVIMPMEYTLDEVTYDGTKRNSLSSSKFYNKLREGKIATTSMINPDTMKNSLLGTLQADKDILYISFSSALSGTYQSGVVAANELREEYPNRKIHVIDSVAASLGEGLLVYYALRKRETGATIEETIEYIEELIPHICHFFTVDDLFHLYRGGRVSKSSALMGTIMRIKPVLHLNDSGKLLPLEKVVSRKQALKQLVNIMEVNAKGYDNPTVWIGHGDCKSEAEFLASKIKERLGITNIIIDYLGPVIGSHAGPGTIALFYVGAKKDKVVNS